MQRHFVEYIVCTTTTVLSYFYCLLKLIDPILSSSIVNNGHGRILKANLSWSPP